MFDAAPLTATDKPGLYAELARQIDGLLHGETHLIANAANFAALVFHALPDLNWCGFYLAEGDELVVGPFQGKPACVRIAFGRGVCGTAAATRQTQLVPDVHAFAGHIACDSASRSEIVVPVFARDGSLLGVLDVDSTELDAFDDVDATGLRAIAELVNAN